jgi:hypothetical protein
MHRKKGDSVSPFFNSGSSIISMSKHGYEGSCHCGRIRFRVCIDPATVYTCNCSICSKRNALMVLAHEDDFELLQGEDMLAEYRFHTNTARHFFCKVCGIYPFHRKRMNPDRYGVNTACLKGIDLSGLSIRRADGISMP